MKKLVSLVLSAALVLSSMSVLAAPNIYGIEADTTVAVNLDAKIGTLQTNVSDYPTADGALAISTRTNSATIEARATIDIAVDDDE